MHSDFWRCTRRRIDIVSERNPTPSIPEKTFFSDRAHGHRKVGDLEPFRRGSAEPGAGAGAEGGGGGVLHLRRKNTGGQATQQEPQFGEPF
jgi:hypothetical protein